MREEAGIARGRRNDFKRLAVELKPRERMEAAGTASVASAVELLAIILKTGAPGCDVIELSRRLIEAFGGVEALVKSDLGALKAGIEQYNKANSGRKISGLGRVKMLELAAAFELARRGYAGKSTQRKEIRTASDAAEIFRAAMKKGAEKETFWVLPLDTKMRPLTEAQMLSVGTVNEVSVHPRDVFAIAVRWNATGIIVAHNHPSGNPAPSKKDEALTALLRDAGKMMRIPVLDHLIIGAETYYSFESMAR